MCDIENDDDDDDGERGDDDGGVAQEDRARGPAHMSPRRESPWLPNIMIDDG